MMTTHLSLRNPLLSKGLKSFIPYPRAQVAQIHGRPLLLEPCRWIHDSWSPTRTRDRRRRCSCQVNLGIVGVRDLQDGHHGEEQRSFHACSLGGYPDAELTSSYPDKLGAVRRDKLPLDEMMPAHALESFTGEFATIIAPYCFNLLIVLSISRVQLALLRVEASEVRTGATVFHRSLLAEYPLRGLLYFPG